MSHLNRRCLTDAEKEEFMNRLLGVWMSHPNNSLRFGQLIYIMNNADLDLFYVEDADLLEYIEDFYSQDSSFPSIGDNGTIDEQERVDFD